MSVAKAQARKTRKSASKVNGGPRTFITDDSCLTSAEIFSLDLIKIEIPEKPKNGKPGIVYLKTPSAEDMILNRSGDSDSNDWLNQFMKDYIVDSAGNPLFANMRQVKQMEKMSAAVYARISVAVMPLISPLVGIMTGVKTEEETSKPTEDSDLSIS